MKAIEYPGVETVQIIFNMFRQRPADRFFDLATEADVGVIVRVPLASGMLTGKMQPDTVFTSDDHRSYNAAAKPSTSVRRLPGCRTPRDLLLLPNSGDLCPMGRRWPRWPFGGS